MEGKYISVEDFIKETEGNQYDIDHASGVQCVDGIKKFNVDVYGKYDFTCGNGWAYGLWTNYGTNGVEKYFDKYDYKDAKKGDWIIWNKGSKEAKNSHVAMFIERLGNSRVKAYGQNQNGNKAFNFSNISENGILGVLRPKIYVTPEPTPTKSIDEIAQEVIDGKWGNGEERKQRLEAAGYNYQEVQNRVNEILYGDKTIKVGTRVKTIGTGNGASDGSANRALSGLTGTVSKIIEGANYPYCVSDSQGALGWYKKADLKAI